MYTLGSMAGKPIDPPPARPSKGARSGERDERLGAGERYGPVAITRLLKDDGRHLILYCRTEDPQ